MSQKKKSFSLVMKMAALYREGATLREIGEIMNLSHVRVRQILLDQTGVELRPRGGDMTSRRRVAGAC